MTDGALDDDAVTVFLLVTTRSPSDTPESISVTVSFCVPMVIGTLLNTVVSGTVIAVVEAVGLVRASDELALESPVVEDASRGTLSAVEDPRLTLRDEEAITVGSSVSSST